VLEAAADELAVVDEVVLTGASLAPITLEFCMALVKELFM